MAVFLVAGGQDAGGIVLNGIILGGFDQRFAQGDDLVGSLTVIHGIEQIIQNDVITGEPLQSLPQDLFGLCAIGKSVFVSLVTDGFHLLFGLHSVEIEQLIRGHPEKGRDGGDHGHVGHGVAVLPLGNGLKGYPEVVGKDLLGYVFLFAQGFDLFSEL